MTSRSRLNTATQTSRYRHSNVSVSSHSRHHTSHLQPWLEYIIHQSSAAILVCKCTRLQHTSLVHTVWVQKNPPLRGPHIFHFCHKCFRIFNQFYTDLLYVPVYARLQIFIQLSPILTKLCHIKRDYPVHIICAKWPPSAETHALTRLRKSLTALLIVVCGKSL